MKFLLGLIIGLLLWPALGYMYFRFGYAPVATAAPPMPFEQMMARMALHARIAAEAPKSSPMPPDPANLAAGAKIYVDNCAFCHGLPNQKDVPPAGKGMFPVPPQLFNPDEMVTNVPVGQTYWKVANGIRLTGMPAFHQSLSTDQMWQVSVLLAHADKLPEPVNATLQPGAHTTIPPASIKYSARKLPFTIIIDQSHIVMSAHLLHGCGRVMLQNRLQPSYSMVRVATSKLGSACDSAGFNLFQSK